MFTKDQQVQHRLDSIRRQKIFLANGDVKNNKN